MTKQTDMPAECNTCRHIKTYCFREHPSCYYYEKPVYTEQAHREAMLGLLDEVMSVLTEDIKNYGDATVKALIHGRCQVAVNQLRERVKHE